MKERPILFNAEMVRAVLDGSKTQTRRVMKPQPTECPPDYPRPGHWWPSNQFQTMLHVEEELQNKAGHWGGLAGDACPFGDVGDRLWVRETWRGWVAINPPHESQELGVARYVPDQEHCKRVDYKATQVADSEPYRPSIHMPRWASRITLEITAVRVERLQDISEDDAKAEGVTPNEVRQYCLYGLNSEQAAAVYKRAAVNPYRELWQSIYGQESWDSNAWVWVVEFKKLEQAA